MANKPEVKAPPNTVVVIGGQPYQLRWDKAAIYRADDIGVFEKRKPGIGVASAAKYVWCMAPESLRERCPTPLEVAQLMPTPPHESKGLKEIWDAINNTIARDTDKDRKNVIGSTSGQEPSSS